jgi:hypothetical protein
VKFIQRNDIIFHERISYKIYFLFQNFIGYALFISNTTFCYISKYLDKEDINIVTISLKEIEILINQILL